MIVGFLGLGIEIIALLIGGAAAVGIIVFMPVLKLVLDIAEYSYSNTRISGMNGALVKGKRYSELLDAQNLDEFVGMLDNSPYTEFFGKLGTNINDETVERAIEEEYAFEKDKIMSILPDSAGRLLRVYFKREEVRLIKNILRGISSGDRSMLGELQPLGAINPARLGSLLEAENVKEFVARLEGTQYYEPLNNAYPEYEEAKNLIFLESAIDRYILDQIWKYTAYAENLQILREFIGLEIDINNIMVSLRAKEDKIRGQELERHLIRGGLQLNEKRLKEVSDAEGVQDVVSLLEQTNYGPVLSEVLPKYDAEGIVVFQNALRKYSVGVSKNFAAQTFQLGPTLAYLIRKENEVTNLKTIVNCKAVGMDKTRIEGMLVV